MLTNYYAYRQLGHERHFKALLRNVAARERPVAGIPLFDTAPKTPHIDQTAHSAKYLLLGCCLFVLHEFALAQLRLLLLFIRDNQHVAVVDHHLLGQHRINVLV